MSHWRSCADGADCGAGCLAEARQLHIGLETENVAEVTKLSLREGEHAIGDILPSLSGRCLPAVAAAVAVPSLLKRLDVRVVAFRPLDEMRCFFSS